jgi:membrane protease YdiL (CAAX protease family)
MKGFLPRTLHPGIQILLLLLLIVLGACVGMAAFAAYAMLGPGLTLLRANEVMTHKEAFPEAWGLLMASQGFLLFFAGAGGALALVSALGYGWQEYFMPRPLRASWWLLAAALLIILILPFMTGLIAWNAGAHFPGFLHGFEEWARAKEEELKLLTAYLTQFSTSGRLLAGFVVIALVPAIAEELVFRGVIQRNLVRWFNSRHIGVWLAAAIFSAIHMQFLGFVPRMFLGLVLGYLYEWSGNILVPMAAHFTQNAFQLLIIYLAQHGQLRGDFDPESTAALPWWLMLLSALASAGLLYWLRQRMRAVAVPTQMLTLSHDGVAVRQEEPLA